jgi:hypothetical protein
MNKDDDKVAIRNAILTNTGIKIFFGGLEPDDADLVERIFFTGDRNLAEWKPGSERPVAVGQDKTTIANWSRAEMEAHSEMTAHTRSHSRGSAYGRSTSQSTGFGTAVGSGESSGQVLTPPFQLRSKCAERQRVPDALVTKSRLQFIRKFLRAILGKFERVI